jgi:hypothetical protein
MYNIAKSTWNRGKHTSSQYKVISTLFYVCLSRPRIRLGNVTSVNNPNYGRATSPKNHPVEEHQHTIAK